MRFLTGNGGKQKNQPMPDIEALRGKPRRIFDS
jgi:hypothetical protein